MMQQELTWLLLNQNDSSRGGDGGVQRSGHDGGGATEGEGAVTSCLRSNESRCDSCGRVNSDNEISFYTTVNQFNSVPCFRPLTKTNMYLIMVL